MIVVVLGALSGCVAPPRPQTVYRSERSYAAPAVHRTGSAAAGKAGLSAARASAADLSAAEKERLFREFEQQQAEVK